MFAINHASAALIFKKQLKDSVSTVWILLAVQFVELLWVIFNLIGIEKTTTEVEVKYLGDIHLIHMPFSHSLLSSIFIASLGGIIFYLWKKSWRVGIWMAIAFFSHFVLDVVTHAKDLALGFEGNEFLGLGLYNQLPLLGFLVELGFGVFCWWYYKGGKALLWTIILFNLSNITMFIPQIGGLETLMANRPTTIVLIILFQIIVTLFLIGYFSIKHRNVEHPKWQLG